MATKQESALSSFLVRLLISALLVFSTYNPTGYSYYHWVMDGSTSPVALKVLAGTALALLYGVVVAVMIAAFRRSGLIVGFLAAMLFTIEFAIVLSSGAANSQQASWRMWLVLAQYGVLISVALLIAFGISWSHLIERLTGQQQKRYVR